MTSNRENGGDTTTPVLHELDQIYAVLNREEKLLIIEFIKALFGLINDLSESTVSEKVSAYLKIPFEGKDTIRVPERIKNWNNKLDEIIILLKEKKVKVEDFIGRLSRKVPEEHSREMRQRIGRKASDVLSK